MNRRFHASKGSILITVLGTMAILAALVAAAITLTGQFSRNAARSRAMAEALAIGDGAMEMLYADWQVQSRNYALIDPCGTATAFTPSITCRPSSAEFPGLQAYSAGANKLMIDPAS